MRLIDADELRKEFQIPYDITDPKKALVHITRVLAAIDAAPEIEAIPLGMECWLDRFDILTRQWKATGTDGVTETKVSFIIHRKGE